MRAAYRVDTEVESVDCMAGVAGGVAEGKDEEEEKGRLKAL